LIFTSPPYLSVIRYGKQNWIRLWLLGADPQEVDGSLFASASTARYVAFMRQCLASFRQVLADDGYVCLVIGDVTREGDEIDLASLVASESVRGTGLHVLSLITDELPTEHKVSRIWGKRKGNATRRDRILVLGPDGNRALPLAPSIPWLGENGRAS
jgi:site-specific DNA-methyltransferase (adenine-specific)